MGRIQAILGCLLSIALLGVPSARSAEFPDHPIKLIVPYGAGGGTDVIARLYAAKMAENLKQPIVVENRPGASTIIGAQAALAAPADGYTLLMGDGTTFAVNPSIYKKLAYDPVRDFAPVGQMTRGALVLVVSPSLGVNTIADFVRRAKEKPASLNYGTPGTGTPHHLAIELLQQRTGISLVQVPYRGEAPAAQDVLAGSLSAMFLGPVVATPHISSGKLIPLAVSGSQRIDMLSNVPTMKEAGISEYDLWYWHALVAPRGTPDAIVERLNAALKFAAEDPSLRTRMAEMGVEVAVDTPKALQQRIATEIGAAAAIVKLGNISID